MRGCPCLRWVLGGFGLLFAGLILVGRPGTAAAWAETAPCAERALWRTLDAPLLFVKRHSYRGIHIYDTYYKWVPGGGIYILENPGAPKAEHRVRPLIDPTTHPSLGDGIYSEPDISWDGKRVLFCYKPSQHGSTSIHEIGIDGTGLRRLSDPRPGCVDYKGVHGGHHDVSPAYLPDGRIVFTSTRPNGLVPCANSGVDILHVMNADGTGIRPISVNNVNEFDPCVLPDGRILHGRWEYVDKTALTQQSLWTIYPDGTNETALFANNMVHPEALLDARPVPGAPHLIAASFTPHNAPPRGTIGIVDTRGGKNNPQAIVNFERKDDPTFDRGNSCEPWPLSKEVVLFSGRPKGYDFNVIEIMDSSGRREVVYADPEICCHSPMLVKPRPAPPVIPPITKPNATTGRFYVQDIYQGLSGVERGEVKWLRVIEETSRASGTPGGAYNQTFLVSAALAFSVKNYLGIVPVAPDGSAYFEVPSGRAVYFQALDAQHRLIQSMRTFVQAAPGTTRSCIGCHEYKYGTPASHGARRAMQEPPARLQPESWGTGFIDYPSMVQPILDRHCTGCHGGKAGIAAGLDLSSGWTEHFNISYENLVSRRETQLTAHLIGGIDCMNGTSLWSARIFPPRSHGSAIAPLAELLVNGHDGRIEDLTRRERDLIFAWIDSNGLYYGTWDYTKHGCQIKAWGTVKQALIDQMRATGCMRCHEDKSRVRFESDWFNLAQPERSRILRAPLAKGGGGWGLAWCRDREVDPSRRRVQLMTSGNYVHQVRALDTFKAGAAPPSPDDAGTPVVTFASAADPNYQAMLAIIRKGRRAALSKPRVDMPGAEIQPGVCRQLLPPPLPDPLPSLDARVDAEGTIHLSWERSARTIGLEASVYRGTEPGFVLDSDTLLATTPGFQHTDRKAPSGTQHYALVLASGLRRSPPIRTTLTVPIPKPRPAPSRRPPRDDRSP